MSREYFKLWYRLDGTDSFLIWYTDEKDGFVVDSRHKIPTFQNEKDLLNYAETLGLPIEIEETLVFDIDKIVEWLKEPKTRTVDCIVFLDVWNLFEDVSYSVDGDFDKEREKTNKIYDKLFWGNNLPPMTPEGKCYEPIWTKREVKIMQVVLTSGLSLFRRSIYSFSTSEFTI